MSNNIPPEDKDFIRRVNIPPEDKAFIRRSIMQHLANKTEASHAISDFVESIFKIIIIIPQFTITFLILSIFIVADWKIFKILFELESDFNKLSIIMNDGNSRYIIAFLILQLFLFSTRFGVKSTMQLLDKIKSIFSKNKITSPKQQ
ncbi:hypothetical protein [Candidatus Deianiraea vastatrix]|uniref:Uncharacterized protein n=1 Tax=Candidatus Deianiraea vastatrix TaxID=2163644 RepID=A0A5B8XGY0_9RICK|nr:hypothetical protein [Candidatus Deianiraea vastatrix]QED23411.1 hypothetical protein Deia_00617 [Candidatus Deianiraea vastatrix]